MDIAVLPFPGLSPTSTSWFVSLHSIQATFLKGSHPTFPQQLRGGSFKTSQYVFSAVEQFGLDLQRHLGADMYKQCCQGMFWEPLIAGFFSHCRSLRNQCLVKADGNVVQSDHLPQVAVCLRSWLRPHTPAGDKRVFTWSSELLRLNTHSSLWQATPVLSVQTFVVYTLHAGRCKLC